MPLYLKIAAIALLSIILFSLRKYSHINAKRSYQSTIYNAVSKPLIKVYLKVDPAPDWIKTPQPETIIKDFKSIGFTSGKSYIIAELNDLLVHSLFLGNYAAMVVKHPQTSCWAEVCLLREDGKFILATNSPLGEENNSHPDNKIIYNRDASAIGLYNLLKLETEHCFATPITEVNFKSVIEQYHRREFCRKNNQGGITIQEFKNNIKNINEKLKITKKDLRKVFLEMKVDELHQWHEACIFEYRNNTNHKATKFDYMQYEFFIVPNKTISQAYIEYLTDYGVIDKKMKEKLVDALRKKTNIQKIFETINDAISSNQRAQCVGEVEYPLAAKIYQRGFRLI